VRLAGAVAFGGPGLTRQDTYSEGGVPGYRGTGDGHCDGGGAGGDGCYGGDVDNGGDGDSGCYVSSWSFEDVSGERLTLSRATEKVVAGGASVDAAAASCWGEGGQFGVWVP